MLLTIDQLLDSAYCHAKAILINEPNAKLMPSFLIQYKSGSSTLIATPWDGEYSKSVMIQLVRKKLHERNVHSYSFVSEAWRAFQEADDKSTLPPAERPDRQECIIINASDHSTSKMRTYLIHRDSTGLITDLPLTEDPSEGKISGRLYNMLKD